MRWTKKRREEFHDAIDLILSMADIQTDPPPASVLQEFFGTGNLCFDRRVKTQVFQEAELFFPNLQVFHSLQENYADAVTFNRVNGRSDLPKRYSTSICFVEDGYAHFYGLRSVPFSEIRGTKILSPWFAKYSVLSLDLESGIRAGTEAVVFWSNNRWKMPNAYEKEFATLKNLCPTQRLFNQGDTDPEETNTVCNLLAGLTFSRDIHWRVVIKTPDGNSFSLVTDSHGASAAFKDRTGDTPSGRRPALRNWVSEHLRQVRQSTPDGDELLKLVLVRKHLRGRIPFTWCGFDCELVVAPFDVRYNERLAVQRQLK